MLPSSIVIGLPRAGTTFLYDCIRAEGNAFVPVAKDVLFFDREFDRGLKWYSSFFEDAEPGQTAIDISHGYFFHPAAPHRVERTMPEARLTLIIRDPADWVVSMVRRQLTFGQHGQKATVDSALSAAPQLLASAHFSHLVQNWMTAFGDRLQILLFDSLSEDPLSFYQTFAEHAGYEATIEALPSNRKPVTARAIFETEQGDPAHCSRTSCSRPRPVRRLGKGSRRHPAASVPA